MSEYVDATFYAQVEPEWAAYGVGEERGLRGAKVARTTQRRPDMPLSGTVLVKLTIRIPKGAFLPLRPAAIVTVPEDMTVANPIDVVVEDPAGDAS